MRIALFKTMYCLKPINIMKMISCVFKVKMYTLQGMITLIHPVRVVSPKRPCSDLCLQKSEEMA